jgi:magnesium chelatase family protein
MLAKLQTFALVGIDAVPVVAEVDASPSSLPKTILVGLPEAAVRESIHRIERAMVNLGYRRHAGRTVINLAPAELKKDAGAFDLPIALALLVATGQIPASSFEHVAIAGELALDGTVRPIRGGLSMAMSAASRGIPRLIVPLHSAREAAVVKNIEVLGVQSLAEAVGVLTGQLTLAPVTTGVEELFSRLNHYDIDFADVRGQEYAKRALTVAAAGAHNVLLLGPPGTGKSMLSARMATILPPLTEAESLETTRVYSATGRLPADQPLLTCRPVRAPHHTISEAGMVGGGNPPAPGEISLAHHGILFLDELPEFNRKSLEVLRQPLETGNVTIARALRSTTFPARFVLVAAMNPCPCGYLGSPKHACKCSPTQIERYIGKISGPLLDRIDLHVEVPAVAFEQLSGNADGTSSATMREQVTRVRGVQTARFGIEATTLNGRMNPRQVREHCVLGDDSRELLRQAMETLNLSARAHDRILRVARTIADLEQSPDIEPAHLIEAIGYRTLDRKLWQQ